MQLKQAQEKMMQSRDVNTRPLTKFSSLLWPYRGPWFLASCHLRDVAASRSHPCSWGVAVSPSSQQQCVDFSPLRSGLHPWSPTLPARGPSTLRQTLLAPGDRLNS